MAQPGSALCADLAAFLGQRGAKAATVSRYWSDPVLFARECYRWPEGESLSTYQADNLNHLVSDMRVCSRGPRGNGKSATNAIAIDWFAVTRELAGVPWKIVTTAGAWSQLEDYLWPEVHIWTGRLKWDVLGVAPWREDKELLRTGINLRCGHATAANPKVSARIEGGHAAQFLYIFDEAKLIPGMTWDSAEGSAASATGSRELRWLAQSSGGDADGRFFDISTGKVRGWWTRHVTKDEAIAAGRMQRKWAEDMEELWGEMSPAYQNHVLGNFAATGGTNTVVRMSDVERAVERWRERRGTWGPQDALGVDVGTGNLNRDPATIAFRHGRSISRIDVHRFESKYPEMELVGIVGGLLTAGGVANVDAIGQGAGVVSRLVELGKNVRPFVAGAGSTARDKSGAYGFLNQRAEWWWKVREDLADPESDIALPDDPILLGELTAPGWDTTSNSRIQIESKEEISRRLKKLESRKAIDEGGSTNRADAVVMAFADTGEGGGEDTIDSLPRPTRTRRVC